VRREGKSTHNFFRMIKSATCLFYTPSNEHFGIVPLEAAALGTVVVACNRYPFSLPPLFLPPLPSLSSLSFLFGIKGQTGFLT
jgi:hypothetical protein